MEKIKLPTGYLFTDTYSNGKELETLSIGDYGKDKNIKADFLGFPNEVNGVPNGPIKPMSEKWVITLSTQYGCSMKCAFCDVPNVKFGGNVSKQDMQKQLYSAISMFPDVKYTDRLNIHFARMGEPLLNFVNTINFALWMLDQKAKIQEDTGLRIETLHPVISTMVPNNSESTDYIRDWMKVKNNHLYFNGQAGLQLSINSTDETQRKEMFQDKAMSLEDISKRLLHPQTPIGRKYTLNFALADGYETDGEKLAKLFDPEYWMVKITPIHNNNSCKSNGIKTNDGYNSFTPYKEAEESFKKAGFDTLVFIPSMDEENGCVTCGNAILGGSELKI
jgi:23S rRNA (adenine2503-C2)-methyltransferase